MVTVRVDEATKKIKANFSQLNDVQIAKATANAINRTLSKGRTEARKEVKRRYNIPQKNLEGINQKNASKNFLQGYIYASSKPIPADAFSPKFETAGSTISISKKGAQKITANKKKESPNGGVSLEIVRGQRQIIPFAFLIPNAKPRVFARGQYRTGGTFGFVQRHNRINSSGSDTPLASLLSVTVFAAIINDAVESRLSKTVNDYYEQRLEHELNYALSKMKE